MAASPNATRPFPSAVALALALIGSASFLYYHQRLFTPRAAAVSANEGLGNGYSFGNDFYQVWLSSRELFRHRSDPYGPQMTQAIQVGLYGRPLDPTRAGDPVDRRVFPYPAYADLLFWPAAEISFPAARVVVLCILLVATFASIPMWLRAFDWRPGWNWTAVILLLTLTSYPALEGLFAGQIGLFVAFLLAAATMALFRRKFLLAGVLMAISTIKPQVTALAIVYLLLWSWHDWRERKFFTVGFFSTLASLLASSLIVLPHWIQNWTHTVLAYRHYTRPPLVTEVLTSPLGPRFSGPATTVLTAAAVITAILLAWRNREATIGLFRFWFTLSLLLSITAIVVLPGQAVYDHLILVPAILLLVRYRHRLLQAGHASRMLVRLGALVLVWPWMAALGLIVLRPFLSPAVFDSTAILSLPIRNAASLPFVVIAMLAWMWRVNVRTKESV